MNVLFLDIDGVLNGHCWNEAAQSCDIDRDCVRHLNSILKATGAKIVLSSAWRYIVHGGDMTLLGFGYMLRTHGLWSRAEIIDLTCKDEDTPGYQTDVWCRGTQIRRWLAEHPEVTNYVILDDDNDFDGELESHFVRCGRDTGLTAECARLAIGILNGDAT